jgi:hypothetical protein
VDLPTLGFPMIFTKPALCFIEIRKRFGINIKICIFAAASDVHKDTTKDIAIPIAIGRSSGSKQKVK